MSKTEYVFIGHIHVIMRSRNRILAVDDDVVDIATIQKLLGVNYDLKTARTGEEALQIVADFWPDIILLDNMMSGIDGRDVCRQIRADSELRHIKIIMVSGQSMVSERLEAYQAGADDYITKPLDKDELLAKIEVFLRLKSVEEVDQFKTNVLTLLSHEARTPLNSLIGPAEMLISGEQLDAEEQKLLVEMVYCAAKRLHRFFENVTLLSSLKSGKWEFSPAPTNLCDILHGTIQEITTEATERHVKIEVQFDASPIACLDRKGIKRVVTTLLDNAIRFSPADGRIGVSVFCDNGDVCVRVTDEGKGIDPNYLPYVFEELSDPDIDHHAQGQGLSLAIARQIVQRHNGIISVESTKGSGATFTVRLPVMILSEGAH